jgi:hypothetical protein
MQRFLCLTVGLLAVGLHGSPAFETRSVSSAGLKEHELQRYERLKKAPGVLRIKLVSLNEEALSHGAWVELPLFGNVREGFRVSKDERDPVWKGRSGKNFDRFVIRKIGGRYSGHVLYKGRQYVLTPVKSGVSALYELDGQFECGMDNNSEVAE